MVSVIIAAHNEESSIGECLDALLSDNGLPRSSIVVSANACTDATVAIARSRGVIVVDRSAPGKAAAINAAELVADSYPRLYLDADIMMPAQGVTALLSTLDRGALAAVPRRRIELQGRPWAVRSYFAVNERLPAFRSGLFGRGLIAVSRAGRERFEEFPEMVADDLFLDAQFNEAEKAVCDDVVVTVEAPYTVRDLLNRLTRVRRGNREMRAASQDGSMNAAVRSSDKWAWLRDVVLPDPRLWAAALPYAALTLRAALLARRAGTSTRWERDESTRGQRKSEAS